LCGLPTPSSHSASAGPWAAPAARSTAATPRPAARRTPRPRGARCRTGVRGLLPRRWCSPGAASRSARARASARECAIPAARPCGWSAAAREQGQAGVEAVDALLVRWLARRRVAAARARAARTPGARPRGGARSTAAHAARVSTRSARAGGALALAARALRPRTARRALAPGDSLMSPLYDSVPKLNKDLTLFQPPWLRSTEGTFDAMASSARARSSGACV
jgi:hypothetical protein